MLLVGFTCVTVWDGYRRRRVARNTFLALLVLITLWGLAALVISTDWRDADGYVDCWPNCSGVQDTVGVLFWVAPAAAVVLAASALVISLTVRRRKAPKMRRRAEGGPATGPPSSHSRTERS